ncbi:MAG TPA: hypothetical protein VFH15_14860, partial [Pyrinomonadaceae bacterium]|nr:hypothetical protein [Pyrinomonadaceae bacterium]
ITQAAPDSLPKTRVIVLAEGRIVFGGTVAEFQRSNLPAIKELLALDRHDHAKDIYFTDPWDKRRQPKERLL